MDTTQPPDGVKYDAAWAANRCAVENGSSGWQDFIQQAIDHAVAKAKADAMEEACRRIDEWARGCPDSWGEVAGYHTGLSAAECQVQKLATNYRQQAKESSHE